MECILPAKVSLLRRKRLENRQAVEVICKNTLFTEAQAEMLIKNLCADGFNIERMSWMEQHYLVSECISDG